MDELAVVLVLLAVGLALSGPAAFIMALVGLNKIVQLRDELLRLQNELRRLRPESPKPAAVPQPVKTVEEEKPQCAVVGAAEEPIKPDSVYMQGFDIPAQKIQTEQKKIFEQRFDYKPSEAKPAQVSSFEQVVGTRWILVGGILCVIAAVGFFLKYAYDNALLGPWARVGVVAGGGLLALIIGEITRRRGYEIVAKGVGALGFALLYAATFSAYRAYELIDATPAFGAAIVITIAAMAYAVMLDEVLIAFLSLLGGFLTPLLLSTGQNLPHPLFGYVLVLSLGAIACAFFRRWRAVNLTAFIGTFAIYTLWFEKFMRPILLYLEAHTDKLLIAGGWLGVFFAVYLVLPLCYGFIKKTQTRKEDIVLPCLSGIVTLFYLWTMLDSFFRPQLALCTAAIGTAYFAMAVVGRVRCRQDRNMVIVLSIAGIAFVTAAIPMYFKTYAVIICWIVESVVLLAAGVVYLSLWTQACGLLVMAMGIVNIFWIMREPGELKPYMNPVFGMWMFAAAAAYANHWLYRIRKDIRAGENQLLCRILFVGAAAMALFASCFEWRRYLVQTLSSDSLIISQTLQGALLAGSVFIAAVVMRPFSPGGGICRVFAAIAGVIFSCVAIGDIFDLYVSDFRLILNTPFLAQMAVAAAIFVCAIVFRREARNGNLNTGWHRTFAPAGVVLLWIIFSEQIYLYWYCLNNYGPGAMNWQFKAQLSLSVLWAVYGAVMLVIGFWQHLASLRYMTLGLFGLLLVKVFLVDTSSVRSVYRIMAFMATGLTLVGVSYLYQFLKKKGFFDAMEKD